MFPLKGVREIRESSTTKMFQQLSIPRVTAGLIHVPEKDLSSNELPNGALLSLVTSWNAGVGPYR